MCEYHLEPVFGRVNTGGYGVILIMSIQQTALITGALIDQIDVLTVKIIGIQLYDHIFETGFQALAIFESDGGPSDESLYLLYFLFWFDDEEAVVPGEKGALLDGVEVVLEVGLDCLEVVGLLVRTQEGLD